LIFSPIAKATPMPQTPFDALALAPFAVYLRPEDGLFLPGYEGAAFRRGFGSVFKSIACPAHPVDCLHARLGQRSVYSEVFETPVPSDSGVMRERREKHHFLLTARFFLPDPAAAGPAIIFPRFPVTISRVMESIKEKPQSL
jgi:hypothetical protein